MDEWLVGLFGLVGWLVDQSPWNKRSPAMLNRAGSAPERCIVNVKVGVSAGQSIEN